MADSPKSKGKGPSRKLGPLPAWGWAAAGVATFGVYYLYKKRSASATAAATGVDPSTALANGVYAPLGGAGIDPTTGLQFSQETGSNAIDPLTGQTYASELAGLTGTGSTAGLIDPTTGIPFSVELQNAIAGLTPTATTQTGTVTTPSPTGLTPVAFAQGLVDQLTKAYGPGTGRNLSASTITDQVNKYLNGQAITNSVLAQGIRNITGAANSLGSQAIATGGLIKPVITSPTTTTVTHTPSEVVAPLATTPPKSAPIPTAPTGGSAGGLGVIAPGKSLTNTASPTQSAAFVNATTKPSTTQADRVANTANPTGITGTLITGPLQAAPQTAANLINTFVVGPGAVAGRLINNILGF